MFDVTWWAQVSSFLRGEGKKMLAFELQYTLLWNNFFIFLGCKKQAIIGLIKKSFMLLTERRKGVVYFSYHAK